MTPHGEERERSYIRGVCTGDFTSALREHPRIDLQPVIC